MLTRCGGGYQHNILLIAPFASPCCALIPFWQASKMALADRPQIW